MERAIVRLDGVHTRVFYDEELGRTPAAIVFGGFPPSTPRSKHHPEVRELVGRGYAVFAPEYPGTYDSSGRFSPEASLDAAITVIEGVRAGSSRELWSEEMLSWDATDVVLVGTSFGGPVALCAAALANVPRVFAASAVVDWGWGVDESDEFLAGVLERAYPHTARLAEDWNDWQAINATAYLEELREKDVFLLAAEDDEVVPCGHSERLAELIGCELLVLEEGGHVGPEDAPGQFLDAALGVHASS